MAAYEYESTPIALADLDGTVGEHHDTYPAISPTAAPALPPGRAVLVTGASKGVGKALAISYAQAGASHIALGARSDLADVQRRVLAAAEAAGRDPPQVLALRLDVQDPASVAAAVTTIGDAFGKLDILVNNAGALETWTPLGASDPAAWWNTWDISIRATYDVTRQALPLLVQSAQKTVVNVASGGAHLVLPGASAYQTAKFAQLRLTEFLCRDHAADGLLAYAVHPGAIGTELSLRTPEYMHAYFTDTPELAADAMVFLTRERRVWLAGRYVHLNWDLPDLLAREEEIVAGDKLKMKMVI